ncbi:MAG: biotin synthase [Candidatus Methanofastidiosum methylothiophilum]|uniref:Biotin synthase n=1 Tax=Candidatus Methanofastidiosum methylothiophilum TaxID=1705564 RepID=A0A150IJJ1_9EURY|nr:MAG: biotin synthase [Candidatus Methanofastidiosum methylthiophilus]KYC47567.1 MAG: biotin synthase [Candidatus Methanofastidiosum methylthiophilus]KYC50165.1 MAG: biotin synthase [Candidatus Methanofastidiosum methylthiophilus]
MNVLFSLGSAVKLGLKKGTPLVDQRTCYLMMEGQCNAGCLFCIRPKEESKLSRLPWYSSDLVKSIPYIESNFERVCIQSVNRDNFIFDLKEIISKFSNKIPISASLSLKHYDEIELLHGNVDKIGIGLDCVRKDIFKKIKPYYSWNKTWKGLKKASEIFGDFNVVCHLISGLGETEEDMVKTFHKLFGLRIYPSLFALTPIKGTVYEQLSSPDILSYRRVQLAHYLITSDIKSSEDFTFNNGKIVYEIEDFSYLQEDIFITRGCPSCDRPFYNESPKGNIYNFPNTGMISLSTIKNELLNHKIY